MRLWCPSCDLEFGAVRNPRNGNHHEFACPCGQALQWDWQSENAGTMYGPPKECQHPDLKNDNTCVPDY